MKRVYIFGLAIALFSSITLKAQVDLNSGLVAFYPFNSNALDSSGKGNNGNIYGAIPTLDRFNEANSAYSFDGYYNTFSNSTIFPNAPTAFTISWWLKPVSNSNWGHLLGAANGWGAFNFHSTVNNEVYVGTESTNRLTPTELGAGTVTLNVWQNFTFTYANNIGSFYKDGFLLASKAMDAPMAWNGLITTVDPSAINGSLDDIRVYDRALNNTEIEALFNDIPNVMIIGSTSLCNGNTTSLSIKAIGSTSYKWNDDQISNSVLKMSPTKDTYYKFSVFYPNKTVNDSILVKVYENVTSTVQINASDINPCSGDSVGIVAKGASIYIWDNGKTTESIKIKAMVPIWVYVTPNACPDRDSIFIDVRQTPVLTVQSSANSVCLGSPVTFTVSGADNYKWANGETKSTIVANATFDNSYTLTATNNNGCFVVSNPMKSTSETITKTYQSSIYINSSTVDLNGDVWMINSNNKLEKYDGTAFVEYTDVALNYTNAYTVIADKSGKLWLSTNAGLYVYDGNWLVSSFPQNSLIPNGDIRTVYIDQQGFVWVLFYYYNPMMSGYLDMSNSGLYKYDGISWTNISVNTEQITNIAVDSKGSPWVSYQSEGSALYKYDGSNWVNMYTENYQIANPTITADSYGNIWYGDVNNNLIKTDGITFTPLAIPNSVNPSSDWVVSIFVDPNNKVWFCNGNNNSGNNGNGFSSYNNGDWTNFKTIDGLTDDYISGIFNDVNGNIYAQGENGISKVGLTFKVNPLPKISILSTENAASNKILIASGGRNYLWNDGETSALITVDPPTSTMYTVTVTSDLGCSAVDSIVASTVLIYNNEKEVCEGTILTLTAAGAESYKWSTGETTNSIVVTVTPGCKYTVTGTNSFGISASDSIQDKGSKSWETIDIGSSISSSTIDKQGNMWAIANVDGYLLMKKDSIGWSIYDDPNGNLNYNYAYSVITDKNGYVWFSTSSGIYRYDGSTWQKMYDQDNWSLSADRNGKIWTVTAGFQSGGGMALAMSESLPAPQAPFNSGTTTNNPAGFYQFDGQGWLNFTPNFISNPYNDIYYSTVDAKSNVWLTYYNSNYSNLPGESEYLLAMFDGNSWKQIPVSNFSKGLFGGYITSDSKGAVYIQGKGVIYKTDGTSWIEIPYYNDGTIPNNVNSLFVDKNDILWASFYLNNSSIGGTGLSKYENGTWITFKSSESGIADNSISNIFESADGIIYAQGNQTISKFGYPFQVNALPISKITAFPATICNSQPVVINASGASTYIWGTGDLNSEITVSPLVSTSYPVTLTSSKGCSIKDTFDIVIPKTTITVSKDSICANEKVVLKASGAKSYMWSIGSQKDSIIVQPKETTMYTVYSNTENGCSKIDSAKIVVNQGPTLTVTADPISICQTSTSTLSVSGGTSYEWNTGETQESFDVNPLSTRFYMVSSTDKGCTSVDSVKITVNVIPSLTVKDSVVTICSGSSALLSASGGKNYLWSNGVKTAKISVSPKESQTYFVIATASNGCSANDSVIVKVNELPSLTLQVQSKAVCLGNQDTITVSGAKNYTWNVSQDDTNKIVYLPTQSTLVKVTGVDSNGCSNSESTTITVNQLPTITASVFPTTICIGAKAKVQAIGAVNYIWDNAVISEKDFEPVATQTYSVTGTDSNGCSSTANTIIVVNELPTVKATATKSTLCSGDTIKLIGVGAVTYVWDNAIIDSKLFVPTASQTYTITGTDIHGCSNIDSIAIEVTTPTIPVVKNVTMLVNGTVPMLTAIGNDVKWYDQYQTILLATGNTYTPNVNASAVGTYSFKVTNSEKICETKPVIVYVSVLDIPKITITSPVADSYIPLSSVLTIQADASKQGGTIDSVVFYAKSAKIGVATSAPYSFDWVVEGSDSSEIIAIAYDNSGANAITVNKFRINEAPYLTQGSISEQIAQKDSTFAAIDLASYVLDAYTSIQKLNVSFSQNPYLALSTLNGRIFAKQLDSTWSGTTPILCTIADEQGMELQLPILYTQPYVLKTQLVKPTGGFYASKTLVKVGESIRFYTSVNYADSLKWNFEGGNQISGTDINPVVKYQNPGLYTITMTAKNKEGDTIITKKNYIVVSALSIQDTVLCKGNSLTISASTGFTSYVWNTNPIQTTASITVTPLKSTTYKVTMKKGLAIVIDSVDVTIPKQPELGNDTSFCEGGSLQLMPGSFKSYYWNGDVQNGLSYYNATKIGKIKVQTIDYYGCSAFDSVVISSLYPKPIVNLGKDSTFCWKKNLTLNAGNTGASYLWSTGAKTQTFVADTTKLYSVTVTDSKHCSNSDTISIKVIVPAIPKIGVITLSQMGYNLIAWEPELGKGIQRYKVWRQTNTAGVFTVIDTILKNELTVSIDKTSSPKVKSESYALSIVDSACGNESVKSPIHNSIHLSCVLQNNGTVKATWNNYVGLTFSNYIIYRAVKGQPLVAYDTIAYNPNVTKMVYYDEDAIGLNSYYQVGFDLAKDVTPSKLKSDSGPFSQSMSNMAESELTNVEINSLDAEISAYPNPSDGQFTVSIASEKAKKYTIEFVNELGQILLLKQTVEVTEAKLQIDASNFGSGVYMLKIITNDGIATKRIVITQ